MLFSSLLFLFIYLPVVIVIYYITPRKFRNLFLFLADLIFYGWGEPVYVLLMLFSITVNYVFGLLIDKNRAYKSRAKLLLVGSVVINLGLLGYFKYAGFITNTLDIIIPFANIPVLSVPLPIGISFYTFQTMSYTVDVYRNDCPVQKNYISFGAYVSLFPQLIAGPIVRYKDVAYQLDHRRETLDDFSRGIKLFVLGLSKKVLIANQMGLLWDKLRETHEGGGILASWVGIIAFTLQIYFDFSGYSDMARGLGNMFGFEFLKNFDYPYISKSITEFWRRWHISLGTWFREYVYIPLGGNRKGRLRSLFNILAVWFLTGLWHGASVNFILWGLYFGVLLILEKFVFKSLLDKLPGAVRHFYTMLLVILGWVIFYFSDDCGGISEMAGFFTSLFTGGFVTGDTLSIIISYLPLLIFSCLISTPILKKVYNMLISKKYMWIPEAAAIPAAMLLCISSLVNQSYNPFLYFRF